MAIVYRHIRLDKNEPFYIGIGLDEKRAFEKRKSKRSIFWSNIVSKTDYRVEILFYDLTWSEACEKEKEFIALYGRKDLGNGTLVNMTDGGQGVENRIYNMSNATKSKISNTLKGRKISEESLRKRVESQTRITLCDSETGIFYTVNELCEILNIDRDTLIYKVKKNKNKYIYGKS